MDDVQKKKFKEEVELLGFDLSDESGFTHALLTGCLHNSGDTSPILQLDRMRRRVKEIRKIVGI